MGLCVCVREREQRGGHVPWETNKFVILTMHTPWQCLEPNKARVSMGTYSISEQACLYSVPSEPKSGEGLEISTVNLTWPVASSFWRQCQHWSHWRASSVTCWVCVSTKERKLKEYTHQAKRYTLTLLDSLLTKCFELHCSTKERKLKEYTHQAKRYTLTLLDSLLTKCFELHCTTYTLE